MLNKELNLYDLKSIYPDLYNTLKNILNYNDNDFKNLEYPITFEINTSNNELYELKEGGKRINITQENK